MFPHRVFLHGKVHAEYRRALNVLFTRKALSWVPRSAFAPKSCFCELKRPHRSLYLPIQEKIYRRYFKEWMSDPSPEHKQYMMPMRDLNMETSLRVFCGNYISDKEEHAISDKYWLITVALQLVNFPFAIPGTKVYVGRSCSQKWGNPLAYS